MTAQHKHLIRKYLPLIVGAGLVAYIGLSTDWQQVGDALTKHSIGTLALMFGLSLVFYAAKTIRFWYMLKPIGASQPLGIVAMAYISAQPASLLPAGELYRNRSLERFTGVPMAKSSPTFLMQGVSEGITICALGIAAGIISGGTSLILTIVIGTALVAFLALLANPRIAHSKWVVNAINKLPYVDLSRKHLSEFNRQNRAMLQPVPFAIIIGITLIAELAGIGITLVAIDGLGADISLAGATIAYGLPIIASFVSFLPGGVGAADQVSISTMRTYGIEQGQAVAATLISRFYIVVLGVVFGVVGHFIARALGLRPVQPQRRRAAKT